MKLSTLVLLIALAPLGAAAQEVPITAHVDCAAPAPECVELPFAAVVDKLLVKKDPEMTITSKEVANVDIIRNEVGPDHLRVRLEVPAGEKLRQMTASNLGRRFVLVADGRVLIAPIIQDAIMGGSFVISGALGEGGRSVEWLRSLADKQKAAERRRDFTVMMVLLLLSTAVFGWALYMAFRPAAQARTT